MPPVSLECPPQIPKMPAWAPAESRGNARAAASTDLQRIGPLRVRFVALYHIGTRRAHGVRPMLDAPQHRHISHEVIGRAGARPARTGCNFFSLPPYEPC